MTSVSRKFLCAVLVAATVTFLTIELVEAARRGGGGRAMSRGGPAASGSFQRSRASSSSRRTSGDRASQRREVRQDRVDNRQDVRQDVREDRQDFRREVRDDRKEFRGDRREWYEDRWRRGLFVSVTNWARIGCDTVIIVDGVRYYECGGVRYERVYRGTEVVYIIVD